MRAAHGVAVLAGALLAVGVMAPASADEVPPDWGRPSFEDANAYVGARIDGRVPGRLGNQHVVAVRTTDEEPIDGQLYDWWCPAGTEAPAAPDEATGCRLRGSYLLDLDSGPGWFVKKWGRDLRWLALRAPVRVLDTNGAVVDHGTVSLRVRGTGATAVAVEEEFHEAYVYREGGRVVGGRMLGVPWLTMSDVSVEGLWLYRYYDVPTP